MRRLMLSPLAALFVACSAGDEAAPASVGPGTTSAKAGASGSVAGMAGSAQHGGASGGGAAGKAPSAGAAGGPTGGHAGAGGGEAGHAGHAASAGSQAAGAAGNPAGGAAGQAGAAGAVTAQGGAGQGGSSAPCTTRITYGNAWIHGPDHPQPFDEAEGDITWDGACQVDAGGNAFATLSNGWQPYFEGKNGCIIAIDRAESCGPSQGCSTRITYGDAWLHGPDHPAQHDDAGGVVTWDGVCHDDGGQSFAVLSNGWTPYFEGNQACQLSLRHEQCGGLYANPVVDTDCPDPGVSRVGDRYVMVCTSGWHGYPIRTSTDLVHWQQVGAVFDDSTRPSWATGDFWAPEVHPVGAGVVAYFSARTAGGGFAVGAAHAGAPEGPYTDIGQPLVEEPGPGVIDAHHFASSNGERFILYKTDGNAVGAPTPIKIARLSDDGLSLTGEPQTILANGEPWEGPLVEGPWMIEHQGEFFLFYSANGYASPSYAVGVARASSPLGPFTKRGAPVLTSKGAWAGPGHGSVLRGPSGEWVHVFHAWQSAHVGEAPGRLVLVERVQWQDGWPVMRGGPSSRSQPMP